MIGKSSVIAMSYDAGPLICTWLIKRQRQTSTVEGMNVLYDFNKTMAS